MNRSDSASPNSAALGHVDLGQLAADIHEAHRSLGFERRCRIGGLIHTRIFGGSRLAWRARSGIAHATFRELSRAMNGKISKSELHRCVRTHLLVEDLPFVVKAEHLSVSHVDVVESLTRFEQRRLLIEANERHWSVKELCAQKERLLASVREGSKRPGRPRRDRTQAAASKCRKALLCLEEAERLVSEFDEQSLVQSRERDLLGMTRVLELASMLAERIRGGMSDVARESASRAATPKRATVMLAEAAHVGPRPL